MVQRIGLFLLAILAVPILLGAQTYDLKIYAVGASAPQQTFTLPSVLCGQEPTANPSNVNPTKVEWTDEVNAGKVCKFVDTGSGPLIARPLGAYEGTLTVTTDAGTSGESARAPFFLKALPGVPTGLRFSR
jgi:hypothetical protein